MSRLLLLVLWTPVVLECPVLVIYPQTVRAHSAMHMSGGAMSGQAKTLKGDEEPWVDDVCDDLLEGLEAEEGHGAAVSPQRVDRIEERLQDVRLQLEDEM